MAFAVEDFIDRRPVDGLGDDVGIGGFVREDSLFEVQVVQQVEDAVVGALELAFQRDIDERGVHEDTEGDAVERGGDDELCRRDLRNPFFGAGIEVLHFASEQLRTLIITGCGSDDYFPIYGFAKLCPSDVRGGRDVQAVDKEVSVKVIVNVSVEIQIVFFFQQEGGVEDFGGCEAEALADFHAAIFPARDGVEALQESFQPGFVALGVALHSEAGCIGDSAHLFASEVEEIGGLLGVLERLLPYLVGAGDVGAVLGRIAAQLGERGVERAHQEMLSAKGFEAAQTVGRAGLLAEEGQQALDELAEAALAITDEADDVGHETLPAKHLLQGKALENLAVVGIAVPECQNAYLFAVLVHVDSLSRLRRSGEPLRAQNPIPYWVSGPS